MPNKPEKKPSSLQVAPALIVGWLLSGCLIELPNISDGDASLNTAPLVNAGPDISRLLGDSIMLAGSASDEDHLPNPPGYLTIEWQQRGGPSGLSFGDSSMLVTSVTVTQEGEYVIWLMVSDGEIEVHDEMALVVEGDSDLDIPFTETPPEIDGNISGEAMLAWQVVVEQAILHVIDGAVDNASDLSGSFWALWDAAYLYLLVNVIDDATGLDSTFFHDDDGVEIYIDANHDASDNYGVDDYHFIFRRDDLELHQGQEEIEGVEFAWGNTVSGYFLEVKLPWLSLGQNPSNMQFMGLDVAINDDDDGGARDGMRGWWDITGEVWNTPSLMAKVRLVR